MEHLFSGLFALLLAVAPAVTDRVELLETEANGVPVTFTAASPCTLDVADPDLIDGCYQQGMIYLHPSLLTAPESEALFVVKHEYAHHLIAESGCALLLKGQDENVADALAVLDGGDPALMTYGANSVDFSKAQWIRAGGTCVLPDTE